MRKLKARVYITAILLSVPFSTLLPQQTVRISGTASNASHSSIVLTDYVSGSELARSALGENGRFSLELELSASTICKLGFDEQTFISLILDPGETVTVEVDAASMNEPEITGSKNSRLLYAGIGKLNDFQKMIDDYTANIMKQREEYLYDFLTENKSSLAALFFLEQLAIEEYPGLYKEVTSALTSEHPDNQVVASYASKFRDALFLPVGAEAPEIAMPDPDGNIIKLSSLRGKVVLIDFWAAWCGPCRREAPNVVRVYNKYKDRGFEIYGVSLDRDKESWTKAIEDDKLDWVHVSDLKYWQSDAVSLYGFNGIPYTVLIDREGKIIAKGLRGENLENKLSEIFD